MSYQYSFEAFDKNGKSVSGVIDAPDLAFVYRQLEYKQLTPTQVTQVSAHTTNASVPNKKPRVYSVQPSERFLEFIDSLHLLLDSGFGIHSALVTLGSNGGPWKRNLANELAASISNGSSFSEAAKTRPKDIPASFGALVEAAEKANQLPAAIAEYKQLESSKKEFRSKLLSAFAYPLFVIVLALMVFVVLSLTLAPSVRELFVAENVQVPMVLDVLTGFGRFISSAIFLNSVAVILATLLCCYLFLRPHFLELVSRMKFMIPIIGSIFTTFEKAKMLNSLAILIEHGMSVPDAMRLTSSTLEHQPLRKATSEIHRSITGGQVLSEAVNEHPSLSGIIADSIAVSHKSNSLLRACKSLGQLHVKQAENRAARMSGVLTPILTILVGAIIGTIVYATVSALISINELAF